VQRNQQRSKRDMAAVQAGMEVSMMRVFLLAAILACSCQAQGKGKDKPDVSTNNPPVKVEKEKKAVHEAGKIVVKARDKGSKKESDWKTEREYPLMFRNNRKARPKK